MKLWFLLLFIFSQQVLAESIVWQGKYYRDRAEAQRRGLIPKDNSEYPLPVNHPDYGKHLHSLRGKEADLYQIRHLEQKLAEAEQLKAEAIRKQETENADTYAEVIFLTKSELFRLRTKISLYPSAPEKTETEAADSASSKQDLPQSPTASRI